MIVAELMMPTGISSKCVAGTLVSVVSKEASSSIRRYAYYDVTLIWIVYDVVPLVFPTYPKLIINQ